MTLVLQIVALLRDAAVIVLAGFAITLYKQVIMVKDAEIGQLKSRIEHLEATSAPALLDQNEKMSAALDRYAAKAAGLEEDLKQAIARTEALSTKVEVVNQVAELVGSFKGSFESLIIISEAMDRARTFNILAGRGSAPELDRLDEALHEIHAMVQATFEGKKPSFPHLTRRMQELKDPQNTNKK